MHVDSQLIAVAETEQLLQQREQQLAVILNQLELPTDAVVL
jgi:hypothetical protein